MIHHLPLISSAPFSINQNLDQYSSLDILIPSWKKHLFPYVGSRMTSKEDLCATNKIGLVESGQASGLWYKFADSDISIGLWINFFISTYRRRK